MKLKTIPIRVEDRFLTDADAKAIWQEIKLDEAERLVIALDGAPGTGKSVLAKMLKRAITPSGIEVGLAETDLDCLPWSERPPNSSLMDWHSDTLTREVLSHPGARFSYTGYDPVTHERTDTKEIFSPRRGILIVEGLHSIEFARQLSDCSVVAIPFQISNELRERRRAERNVRLGRWKKSEVESRTKAQRGSAVDYYSDLARELGGSSTNVQNTIRVFR